MVSQILQTHFRSSHRRHSVKEGVLGNFAKFTGKHLCQSFFFSKVAGLRPATLLKKRPWHRCFPVDFAKFFTAPFLTENFRWLPLSFLNYITFFNCPLVHIHWQIKRQEGKGNSSLVIISTHSQILILKNARLIISYPTGNYIFKVNNRNSTTRCEICSKLTIKAGVDLISLLITLNIFHTLF